MGGTTCLMIRSHGTTLVSMAKAVLASSGFIVGLLAAMCSVELIKYMNSQ